MTREINPLHDIVSLWRLFLILRRLKPHIVNAGTPKAGLLGMIAAWLNRIPVRIYQLRGLRMETTSGWQYHLLVTTERLASACAHFVICNSQSLRDECARLGLASVEKLLVLGSGSSNGVDVDRYRPDTAVDDEAAHIKHTLNVAANAPIIGFVGRLTIDKGIPELIDAFTHVTTQISNAILLLIGPFERGDNLSLATLERIHSHPQIITTGYVNDPTPYYKVMRVLAFPSHREGFPNVPLEAAASGVPTVGFDVTGTRDAVINGKTGILVAPGDSHKLAQALLTVLTDETMHCALATAARDRVVSEFANDQIWRNWANFYQAQSNNALS